MDLAGYQATIHGLVLEDENQTNLGILVGTLIISLSAILFSEPFLPVYIPKGSRQAICVTRERHLLKFTGCVRPVGNLAIFRE